MSAIRNGDRQGLPEGWTRKKVGDVATVVRGVSYRKGQTSSEPRDAFIPLLRSGNIRDELELGQGLVYVPAEIVRQDQWLCMGDILVSVSNSRELVGKAAPLRSAWQGTFGTFLGVIRPIDGAVNPAYLAAFFRSPAYRQEMVDLSAATSNIANIRKGHLLGLDIALPPLKQQGELARRIDERLGAIQDGAQSLAAIAASRHALRLAVLDRSLDASWPRWPLKQAILSLKNGMFVSRPAAQPPGIPIFRISAVRPMRLRTDDVRYAPADTKKTDDYYVGPGDLLFTRYSGNAELVGACAIVPELAEPTLHPDKLIRVVTDPGVLDPSFAELACSAGQTLSEIRARRKTTSGQVGISGGDLREVTVPVPPMEVQREAVARVHAALNAVGQLAGNVTRAQTQAQRLRRSVLADAFGVWA